MPQATNPTFGTNSLVSIRQQADSLEIAFKPDTGTTVTWERIPMLSDLGPFQPTSQDASLPLYKDAAGLMETLRASTKTGGSISFSTAAHASNPTTRKLIEAAESGRPILYRARYASFDLMIQGRAALGDRSVQGATTDIPQWSFEILASTAQYVENTSNEIITGSAT